MPSSACDRRRPTIAVLGGVVAIATAAGCTSNDPAPSPARSSGSVTTSPVAPPPWTPADLTYHPCSVLTSDDIAHYLLAFDGSAATPPRELPRCSWSSIQTAIAGSFTVSFAPHNTDLSDLEQRQVRSPLERTATIGGQRAVVQPELRPDGRNGSCSVYVSVPSGGSFYLGIAAPGVATGVDWDVCAKTIDIATTIAPRLR
ncbi:DUF3558 family protein [Nocardia sp. CA-120079]|uniref:DUF3558 family protein n=1 Tax=Nocardia sp. CA-120079 TaxID=3239974 RepID=UPI003D956899